MMVSSHVWEARFAWSFVPGASMQNHVVDVQIIDPSMLG